MPKTCPFLRKPSIEYKCTKYVQLQGSNPNTGQPVNEWSCSLAWLPILLVENSQQTRQAGAAIESFRNEMVQQNEHLVELSRGRFMGDEADTVPRPGRQSLNKRVSEGGQQP